MKKLTPKQRVLKKYPKAFAERNGDDMQIVSPLPYGNVKVLGIVGDYSIDSRRAAWYRAAWNLEHNR